MEISKRTFFLLALSVALFVLAAIAFWQSYTSAENPVETLAGSLLCKARSGKVQYVCLLGEAQCVQTYPDGGKPCRNSSECSGGCYVDTEKCGPDNRCHSFGPPEVGTKVDGVCLRSNRACGEFSRVENGVVVDSYVAD